MPLTRISRSIDWSKILTQTDGRGAFEGVHDPEAEADRRG